MLQAREHGQKRHTLHWKSCFQNWYLRDFPLRYGCMFREIRKSAPWAPNISAEDASCTAPATKNASVQIPFKSPTPAIVFENATTPSRFSHFSLHLPHKTTSERPKCLRDPQFLTLLTSKCASRQNAVHFFDISLPKVLRDRQFLTLFTSKCASHHNAVHFFVISTSKTAPNPSVFNTFYFQMCFAPQRRALFQHLNFQKWSDAEVFCTFSLRNRLRATTACNFSSLISPDVSAPAALASLLFNPPEPQNHEKAQCFATFLPFRAPASSFFWSFLFWLFSLLTAFSSLHIVGSLTSKLLSINQVKLLGIQWESNICHVT